MTTQAQIDVKNYTKPQNCPYPECGKSPVIREFFGGGYACQCPNPDCFLMGRAGKTKREAVENWNRIGIFYTHVK